MSGVNYHGWTHKPKLYGGTDPIPYFGHGVYAPKIFMDDETVTTTPVFDEIEVMADLDGAVLVGIEGYVTTAGASTLELMLHNVTQAVDMLSTPLTIDAGDLNSMDAATQPVIDTANANVAHGDHLQWVITSAGGGALGLGIEFRLLPTEPFTVIVEGSVGPQGDPGGINTWTGAWDSGTTYSTDDAVSNNGSSYVAINGSTNVEPGVDAGWETDWMLLAEAATSGADSAGWTSNSTTLTRTGNFTFTESGNTTAKWQKGTRFQYTQSSVIEYGVVVSSVHVAGTTTVTLASNTDYAMAAGTLDTPMYSYQLNPEGYSGVFNYTPTYTGFSANPTHFKSAFSVSGNVVTWIYRLNGTGTSNATGFTMTFPITPAHFPDQVCQGQNNSARLATPPMILDNGGGVAGLYKDGTGAAWTASGGKGVHFVVHYTI